ncbi:hypothetical protein [Aquimarina macrocephali]|uniref:hypothetical protein n=1 Tax=Aquimarina macrocephali TaxID=666563 RepID=UPI003F6804F0
MKTPKELKFKQCPFGCDCDYELVKEDQKFTSNGNVYQGKRWVYKCPECKKQFTTTESDTISMQNLKNKKL